MHLSQLLDDLSSGVKPIWTTQKVATIMRTQSDPVMSGYILEKQQEFEEFAYLINEGYIDVTSDLYGPVFFTDAPERFETLKKYEEDYKEEMIQKGLGPVYEDLEATSSNVTEIRMKMIWYQQLVEMGSESIEIRKLQYSLYAQDINVMVKVGQINVPSVLDAFKNGLERLVILPDNAGALVDSYYIELAATEKYKKFLKKEEQQQEELKNLFTQPKGKKAIRFPLADHLEKKEAYEEDDLVIFSVDGKEIRGILLAELAAGEEGVRTAHEVFNEQKERYEEIAWSKQPTLRFIKKSTNYFKHKWYLSDEPSNDKRWLVISPKRTSNGEIMSYHAITEDDIQGSVPFKDISKVIFEVFNRKTDPNLQLAKVTESVNKETYTARYIWEKNCIALHISNSLNLIYNRFLHQGLPAYVTLELLFAHELGHADKDSQAIMPELHLRAEKYNRLGAKVKELEEKNKSLYSTDYEATKELEAELKKAIPLFKKFIEIDSKAELDAFINGKKYVSEVYLELFKQVSYEDYLSHIEDNKRQLIALYNKLYVTRETNRQESLRVR